MADLFKNRRNRRRGFPVVLALLLCPLLAACGLLDIKDKGGMENPDVVRARQEGKEDPEDDADLEEADREDVADDDADDDDADDADVADDDAARGKEQEPDDDCYELSDEMDSDDWDDLEDASWLTQTGRIQFENDREFVRENQAAVGVAFLGYTADYEMSGKQEQLRLSFPYLENLPDGQTVEYSGDEWYLIVPESDDWSITMNACSWTDDFSSVVKEKEIFREANGLPIVLRCNLSDLHANVVITAQNGKERYTWCPEYNYYAGEVFGNENFVPLPAAPDYQTAGYLYDMAGSWLCTDLRDEKGKPFFYSVSLCKDRTGMPSVMWFYGGYLDGDLQKITFYWDGNYVARRRAGSGSYDMERGPWEFDFWLNTPDGERSGTIRMEEYDACLYIDDLSGDSFFPYTANQSAVFEYVPESYGDTDWESTDAEADMEYLAEIPEVKRQLQRGMYLYSGDGMEEIDGEVCNVFQLRSDNGDFSVTEFFYAVSPSRIVYRMDYLTGDWELVE